MRQSLFQKEESSLIIMTDDKISISNRGIVISGYCGRLKISLNSRQDFVLHSGITETIFTGDRRGERKCFFAITGISCTTDDILSRIVKVNTEMRFRRFIIGQINTFSVKIRMGFQMLQYTAVKRSKLFLGKCDFTDLLTI